jgi:hypothetical protein
MATRKTWIWIVCAAFGAGVFVLVAMAAASVYFVSKHVESSASTNAQALDAFDSITGAFPGRRALYELDAQEHPHLTAELSSIPTASVRPTALMVQAWNPENQRLIRLTLPLWLLKLGPEQVQVSSKHEFDFRKLSLDINELERIGPAIVLDYRHQDGGRVLLWTK